MGKLEDRMITIAEDPGPWAIMIYGDWGSGKTVLGCQAEGALLLDIDPGTGRRSLLNHEELWNVPIIPCKTLSNFNQVEVDLRTNDNPDIKTIVVDTVTSLQFKDMNAIMKEVASTPGRDPDLPSQAEFNRDNRRIARAILNMIETCNAKDRNVLVLSHDKEEKDKEGSIIGIRPNTSPALTQMLAPMFDGIYYLKHRATSKGEIERTLKTVPTNLLRSKNRFGNLPLEIKDPHFRVIEQAAIAQREKALKLKAEKENQNDS